jgi:drug/metabolite transporter (DMT)-like permease
LGARCVLPFSSGLYFSGVWDGGCGTVDWRFLQRQSLTGLSSQTYGWFIALALIPQLLGHSTFNWSLKYLPAAVVSVTLLAEPVGSICWLFVADRNTRTS